MYYIDEQTNLINVNYGLQHITLPAGVWHIDTKPVHVDYTYFDDGDKKTSTYYYKTKNGGMFNYTLDHSFGVSYFPDNVYFQESHESYLYRLIDSSLPKPTAEDELLKDYRSVDLYRTTDTYVKGENDEFILILDFKLRLVFEYSGSSDYPLGRLIWGGGV